jgi:hypothetical protein
MFDRKQFDHDKNQAIHEAFTSKAVNEAALHFMTVSDRVNYAYNSFTRNGYVQCL